MPNKRLLPGSHTCRFQPGLAEEPARRPPSTLSSAPVRYVALSEASTAAITAIFSGGPNRRIGVSLTNKATRALRSGPDPSMGCHIAVRTAAGCIELQRMASLWPAHQRVTLSVRFRTAIGSWARPAVDVGKPYACTFGDECLGNRKANAAGSRRIRARPSVSDANLSQCIGCQLHLCLTCSPTSAAQFSGLRKPAGFNTMLTAIGQGFWA